MPGATYVGGIAAETLLVKIGDGATPEVFTAPATINADRSFEMTAETKAVRVPRTDDPTKPVKTMRRVTGVDSKITGAGVMEPADFKSWADWMLSGAAKNVQLYNSKTSGLIATGSYVLTQLTETGSQQGELVTAQITLEQADLVVATVAP